MAESPPPTTAISRPRKKNPSQVAQLDTPWPISACSLGRLSQRALAPEATISERVWMSPERGLEMERVDVQVDGVQVRDLELGAEARGLLLHVFDQLRALDAVGPAGKVLDQGGDGELSAGLMAFEDQGFEPGARGVDGGSQTGAAGAQDYGVASVCHVKVSRVDCRRRGLRPPRLVRQVSGLTEIHWQPMDKMFHMANLTLIYGLRLLPEGEVTEIHDAKLKLANGHEAHVTMHVLEGSREEIERQLKQSLDAFFDFYPEI